MVYLHIAKAFSSVTHRFLYEKIGYFGLGKSQQMYQILPDHLSADSLLYADGVKRIVPVTAMTFSTAP